MSKIKIKIAVAVDSSGDWGIGGWDKAKDADMISTAIDGTEADPYKIYWLTAELEIPEIEEIKADVVEIEETRSIKSETGNMAGTWGDLINPLELLELAKLAGSIEVEIGRECLLQMDCLPRELSKEAAQRFKQHLLAIKKDYDSCLSK